MRMLVDAIEAGAFGEIRHLLHIGIGGSALGPDLLVDALGRHDRRYDVAVVSNVDGAAVSEAIAKFSPEHTPVSSDERRVGKECVHTCRHRWSPYPLKNNI